jgi:hypothetical protein
MMEITGNATYTTIVDFAMAQTAAVQSQIHLGLTRRKIVNVPANVLVTLIWKIKMAVNLGIRAARTIPFQCFKAAMTRTISAQLNAQLTRAIMCQTSSNYVPVASMMDINNNACYSCGRNNCFIGDECCKDDGFTYDASGICDDSCIAPCSEVESYQIKCNKCHTGAYTTPNKVLVTGPPASKMCVPC